MCDLEMNTAQAKSRAEQTWLEDNGFANSCSLDLPYTIYSTEFYRYLLSLIESLI